MVHSIRGRASDDAMQMDSYGLIQDANSDETKRVC